jgi:hypothetical protein
VSQSAEALGIKPRGYYQLESYQFIGSVPIWDKLEEIFNVPQQKLREPFDGPAPKSNQRQKFIPQISYIFVRYCFFLIIFYDSLIYSFIKFKVAIILFFKFSLNIFSLSSDQVNLLYCLMSKCRSWVSSWLHVQITGIFKPRA